MPIFTVSYSYQKFSGKINLAYIIVVLGHGLKRTSVKLDLVRTITDSVFIRTIIVGDNHRISNCTDKVKLNGSSLQSVPKDDNNVGQIYFPLNFWYE